MWFRGRKKAGCAPLVGIVVEWANGFLLIVAKIHGFPPPWNKPLKGNDRKAAFPRFVPFFRVLPGIVFLTLLLSHHA
jgi:hypothetical protein